MQTAAFLSYNAIGGFMRGWHEGQNGFKALVIPNSRGQRFAAQYSGGAGNQAVHDEITRLWKELSETIADIDNVVVYVGTDGSEIAIELASQLPTEKVVYVLCDCGLSRKQHMINSAGHGRARRVLCECRGIDTMSQLCRNFLQTGRIN